MSAHVLPGQAGGPSPAPRRWAVAEEPTAVRAVVWGTLGAEEARAIEERLGAVQLGTLPLVVDLTGITRLEDAGVAWLGACHEREGSALVLVVADGRVHRRLTEPGAPRLRLRLS